MILIHPLSNPNLLLLLLLTLTLTLSTSISPTPTPSPQPCQNNATYLAQPDFCSCPPGFLGKTCNITAYEIKDSETTITLGNNYTFVYFKPEEKVVYRFLLTFCPADGAGEGEIGVKFFAQEEQRNGEIDLLPRKEKEVMEMEIGGPEGCKQILSTVLISIDKKPNQQLVRIILGIKLATPITSPAQSSSSSPSQQIIIKCQTNSIFTVSFLATILISFFVIVTVFLLISIIFVLRKKYLEHRQLHQQELKKIECVNSLMPIKKYETLIEEKLDQPENEYDTICSICLAEFEKGQDIRKTPCGHIYHANCLESWCNSHLNCPICRKDFQNTKEGEGEGAGQGQREREMGIVEVEQGLRREGGNVREPML